MMKKTLLAAALAVASSSSFAAFTVDVDGGVVFASERFGSNAVVADIAAAGTEVNLEVTGTAIASGQQGTVTFTLSQGVFSAGDLPVVADLATSDCAGGAAGSGSEITGTPAVITAGGADGDNSVTYGITFGTADLAVGECLTWAVPAVDGLSALGTAGTEVTVTAASAAVGTVDPFNPVPTGTATVASGDTNVVTESAKALSVTFTASAAAEADIQLADRTLFEDGTGTADDAQAILGTVINVNDGTSVDADGATAADYAAADAITVVVTGEDLSGIDTAYIDVDGSGTLNAGDYEAALSGNTLTFVVTDATDVGAAVNVVVVADGTNDIGVGDFSATYSVDMDAATDVDFSGASAADLVATTYSGLLSHGLALVVTNDTSADPTFIRVTNTTNEEQSFFAQMTTQAGVVSDLVELTALAAKETRVITSAQIVAAFGTFSGRSNIEFSSTAGSADDVIILNLVRTNNVLTNMNQ